MYQWFKRASKKPKNGFKKGFRQAAVAGGSGEKKQKGKLHGEKQCHSL